MFTKSVMFSDVFVYNIYISKKQADRTAQMNNTQELIIINFAAHMNGTTSSGNPSAPFEIYKAIKEVDDSTTQAETREALTELVSLGFMSVSGGNYQLTALGEDAREELA